MSIDLNPHALYFPIKRDTKLPLVKGWQGVATDEAHVIEGWLAKGHSLGAVPKPGHMVLDLDVKDSSNGIEWLANNRPALPETWTAQTARGGQHHWFKLPEGLHISNKTGFNPGMDIRAAGRGFVVFHGKFEGKPYQQMPFEGELPIAPQWIIEDAQAKPATDKFADEGSAVITHKDAAVSFYQQALQLANDTYEQNLDNWDDVASNFAWYTAHLYFHDKDLTSKYLEHDLVLDLDSDKPGRGSDKLQQKLDVLEAQYEYMEELEQEREATFWSATPTLERIAKTAKVSNASAWATLAHSLAFVSANTHHNVRSEKVLTGQGGSLNFYVASVGKSGQGKGVSFSTAKNYIEWPMSKLTDVGSGEALLKQIEKSTEIAGEEDLEAGEERTLTSSVFMRSEEISDLATKAGRSGSTIFSKLTYAYTGAEMSNATITNGDLHIPEHSYRLAFDVDVQPRHANFLLEHSASGLPQRFLWVDAKSPHAPLGWRDREALQREGGTQAVKWANPFGSDVPVITHVGLPVSAKDEFDDHVRAKFENDNPFDTSEDGHIFFARVKVATLLAILHGNKFVSEQLWALSEDIMRHSEKTLSMCKSVMAHFSIEEDIGRAKRNATIAHHTEKQTQELSQADMPIAQFAQEVVLPKILETGRLSKSDINHKFSAETRAKAKEGVVWLAEQGLIGEVKEGRKTYYEAA
ncbi:bifunctional DNA primase/polymerase [Glutamicibacter sp. AOP33-2CA-4]|uniref:bifunctional DNA primase/polymerase n=1 Tax=Glutamicibacter sp. AOP33-2CA-4 TaxID=3457690 RepID=UPI0040332CCF